MKEKKRIQSKNKGNRIELKLAKILTERFGEEFRRTPMSGGWGTSNRDSNIREDALEVLSGDIMCPTKFKFSIESKGRADFNFWDILNEDTEHLEIDEWIKQAENDAKIVGKEPLVYVKVNNRKPFVIFPKSLLDGDIRYHKYTIMRFDYFLTLPDDFFFKD